MSAFELHADPRSLPTGAHMPAAGEIHVATGTCLLGAVLVARSTRGLCAILLGDDDDALIRDLRSRFPAARMIEADDGTTQLLAAVVGFIEMPGAPLDLPLDMRGTAFQRKVWQAIGEIPAGATASYAEIARRIGVPGASRAVASACAANMLAVAVPCHRVVRSDGTASGYRWGAGRKRQLLAREANAA